MHEEFDDLCLLYSSGELKGEYLARFEAHLPGCARCAELMDALKASASIAELTAVSLPGSRIADLCGKAAGREPGRRPRETALISTGAWLRFCGAGAVVAALAFTLHFASRGGEELSSSSIERDLARLDRQMSLMDGELADSSVELESAIEDLESQSMSVRSQIGGT